MNVANNENDDVEIICADVKIIFENNQIDDLNKIEESLDNEIKSYNKFTKNNPMLGISWNSKGLCWNIHYESVSISTKNKSLEKATDILMSKIKAKENEKKYFEICINNKITYEGKNILIYGTPEQHLYGILHII